MSFNKRRFLTIAGLAIVLAVAIYCIELAVPKRDYFIERVGTIVAVEHSTRQSGDLVHDSVRITSSTGLEVDMRTLRPETDELLPLALVLGGHETGKDGVDLVGVPDRIAYAAIDYPGSKGLNLDGFWAQLAAVPDVQQSFLDSPPAVSLALSWLLQQPWVDASRVELVGVSLGVPFAAPAGALDERFARVWLLHGGGDNARWVSHVARQHFDNDLAREVVSRLALFAVYGNSFDTRRWILEIAPRPLVIVMARDDDFVPPEAQESLIRAAESPSVELIWTEGRHIRPSREAELRQLLEIVKGRILSSAEAGQEDRQ